MRLTARLFLPFFSLWLAVMPAKSYAVLPLLIPPIVSLVTAGGALTAGDVVGLGIIVTGLSYVLGTSISPVHIATDSITPLPTPPGWTPAVPPSIQPGPPMDGGPVVNLYSMPGNPCPASSVGDLASCMAAAYNSANAYQGVSATFTCSSSNCTYHPISSGWDGGVRDLGAPVMSFGCKAGYGVSGANCVLIDYSAVMKPPSGTCNILRSGSGYAVDPKSPDCKAGGLPALAGAGGGFAVLASNVIITNADGRRAVSVINGDGSIDITISTPNTTASPALTRTTNVHISPPLVAPDALGNPVGGTVVQGVQTGDTAGVGTLGTNIPIVPVVPPIQFPTDYNREVTQGQMRDALTATQDLSTVQPLVDDAGGATSGVVGLLPSVPDMEGAETSIPWLQWANPLSAYSCTPMTGTIKGHAISWDFCPSVAILRDILGWLFAVYTAWELQHLIFRKSA
jgi:hypothetical protein